MLHLLILLVLDWNIGIYYIGVLEELGISLFPTQTRQVMRAVKAVVPAGLQYDTAPNTEELRKRPAF